MVKIYFRDGCAWFEEGHAVQDGDQILLAAVTESLGGPLPKQVPLTHISWYVLIEDGFEGVFPDHLKSYAIYSMNTDVRTPLPREESCSR